MRKAKEQRRKRGLDAKADNELGEELREARRRRRAGNPRGGWSHRFKRMAKSVVVDCMKNTIQVMFYACDYSTKPNMTCAPLLVAIRDGIRRLEEQLQKEEEDARAEELREQLGEGSRPAKKAKPSVAAAAESHPAPLSCGQSWLLQLWSYKFLTSVQYFSGSATCGQDSY